MSTTTVKLVGPGTSPRSRIYESTLSEIQELLIRLHATPRRCRFRRIVLVAKLALLVNCSLIHKPTPIRRSKMTFGNRRMTTRPKSTIRGELRNWYEVELRDTSYFVGHLYG